MLSILICTVPSRGEKLFNLLEELIKQSRLKDVEILYLGDNKSKSVGEKRNDLLKISKGDYVVFIDDDDIISKDYIEEILKATETGKDCLCIGGTYTKNRDQKTKAVFNFSSKVGRNHNHRQNGTMYHYRLPNHICVWKREVALRVEFPPISLGEDHRWAEEQAILGYSEHYIEKELYHYDFDTNLTETRRR